MKGNKIVLKDEMGKCGNHYDQKCLSKQWSIHVIDHVCNAEIKTDRSPGRFRKIAFNFSKTNPK
jgi:hypothetical protein